MIRWILLILATLAVAVAAGLALESDPGLVRVYYGGEVIEMTLAVFSLLSVSVLVGLWAIAALLVWAWTFPSRLAARLRARRQKAARRALTRGLIEIAEGQWKQGERRLVKNARDSDVPLINYLAAARAAQLLREDERRDAYLKAAYESTPAATVAVLLTQAELQLQHQQYEHALATLRRLQELKPGHAYGLKLLARVYEAVGDWRGLETLLPRLRKSDVFRGEDLERIEAEALQAALSTTRDREDVDKIWNSTPRRLRRHPDVALACVDALERHDDQDAAESILRGALKHNWDDRLVLRYGEIRSSHPEKQLGRVESWLRARSGDAALLYAAGQLCAENGLWGKARSYLEDSARIDPQPRTWHRLGELLRELGQPEAAMQAFRKGLEQKV